MEAVTQWLSQYGYAGLFALLVLGIVGLPIPDETLMLFCGYLISQGRLHPLWTFISAYAGAISGISVSYILGATLGHEVVERYGQYIHLTPRRMKAVHIWFERAGDWLLFIGYFIPGVRHFTALIAGTSGLEYRTFAGFAYSGAAIWVTTFLTIGYFVGEKWQTVISLIHHFTLGVVIVCCLTLGVIWIVRKRLQKSA